MKAAPVGQGASEAVTVEVFLCRDGSSVEIRNDLRPGDMGAVVRQHGVLYSRECGFDHTIEIYVARPLSDFAENPGERQRLWIVERDGEFAGSAAIVAHSPGEAQLRWLLLDPSVRGRGIGRHLVSKALAFARQARYRSVFLWTVHILPAAAHIYRSAGFTVTEENAVVQWGMNLREQRYEILFERGGDAAGKGS